MHAGRRQKALRSLGSAVGRLVKKYRLKQQASVSASSKEKDVLRAYKAWCLVVHPDKGGEACDFQKVRAAYESFGSAARTTSQTSPHQTLRARRLGPRQRATFPVLWQMSRTEACRVHGGGNVACGDGALTVCVDEGATPPSTLRIHNRNHSTLPAQYPLFCVHLKSVLYFCPGLTNRPVPDKNKYTF